MKTALKHSALLVLLMTAAVCGMAQQQNPQSIFDRANQHLQAGETRQALGLYHQLENQNQLSGALYLNLGFSYVRLDSMGRAKYYFLKAKQFEETADRAQYGLDYVENQFSRQSAVLPVLPWQRAINWLSDQIGATVLLVIGLIPLNIGVFLYIIPWFLNRRFHGIKAVTSFIAGIGILLVLLSFFINYRQQRYHEAVMVQEQTSVREKPAPNAEMVSQAFEGYTFRVDMSKSKNRPGWYYVRMSNGQYGWIPGNQIMIL